MAACPITAVLADDIEERVVRCELEAEHDDRAHEFALADGSRVLWIVDGQTVWIGLRHRRLEV